MGEGRKGGRMGVTVRWVTKSILKTVTLFNHIKCVHVEPVNNTDNDMRKEPCILEHTRLVHPTYTVYVTKTACHGYV